MTWHEIRAQLPHRWLVVEAIKAYNEGGYRVIPQLAIWKICADDSSAAWDCYDELQLSAPGHEFYLLHTDREELNIEVLDERYVFLKRLS